MHGSCIGPALLTFVLYVLTRVASSSCMQGEQTMCDLLVQYNWSCTFSWMSETVPTEMGIEYTLKMLFIIFETLIIDQRAKYFLLPSQKKPLLGFP